MFWFPNLMLVVFVSESAGSGVGIRRNFAELWVCFLNLWFLGLGVISWILVFSDSGVLGFWEFGGIWCILVNFEHFDGVWCALFKLAGCCFI